MKRWMFVLVGLMLSAAWATAGSPTSTAKVGNAVVEQNLLAGLGSANLGLQRSAALMLGQLGSSRAALPLMAVLRSSTDLRLRIAAAWSLTRIGDPFGTYFVKMTGVLDDDPAVRAYCAWFYNTNVRTGTFLIDEPAKIVPSVSTAWITTPFAE